MDSVPQSAASGIARVVGAFLPRNVRPYSVAAAVRAQAFVCERMDVVTPWLLSRAGKKARDGKGESGDDGSADDAGSLLMCDAGEAATVASADAGSHVDGAAAPAGPAVVLHSISLDRKALGLLAVITAAAF